MNSMYIYNLYINKYAFLEKSMNLLTIKNTIMYVSII